MQVVRFAQNFWHCSAPAISCSSNTSANRGCRSSIAQPALHPRYHIADRFFVVFNRFSAEPECYFSGTRSRRIRKLIGCSKLGEFGLTWVKDLAPGSTALVLPLTYPFGSESVTRINIACIRHVTIIPREPAR